MELNEACRRIVGDPQPFTPAVLADLVHEQEEETDAAADARSEHSSDCDSEATTIVNRSTDDEEEEEEDDRADDFEPSTPASSGRSTPSGRLEPSTPASSGRSTPSGRLEPSTPASSGRSTPSGRLEPSTPPTSGRSTPSGDLVEPGDEGNDTLVGLEEDEVPMDFGRMRSLSPPEFNPPMSAAAMERQRLRQEQQEAARRTRVSPKAFQVGNCFKS
jgi:hypothetical protein